MLTSDNRPGLSCWLHCGEQGLGFLAQHDHHDKNDTRPGALVGCSVVNRTWDSLHIACSTSTEDATEKEV